MTRRGGGILNNPFFKALHQSAFTTFSVSGKTHEDPRHTWASNLMTKLSLRAENRALCHIY
ncbi:hypothetical protein, partial [Salinivibrio costicola]|uniref:hypothetical protein n=1 Tax=Salinivibrio costicola TaxID=51367 RepID=UPI001F29C5D1